MTDYGPATAHELGRALYDTAGAFMLAPPTAARAEELGFGDPLQFYVAGRLGVLGDTPPEVVAAAHGFLAPAATREIWTAVGKVCSREDAAREFTDACARYGEDKLAELPEPDATRMAELAERVSDAAPGTALFAAWRATPRPAGLRARAAYQLHLLREWRGGVHIAALAAAGLTPIEAIMSDGGEFYAEAFGWPKPWPEAGGCAAEIAEVAQTVDAGCGRTIAAALSAPEAEELLALVHRAAPMLP